MLFNSYTFLLVFFPVVFAGYFLLRRFRQDWGAKFFLVLASLYFYGYFKQKNKCKNYEHDNFNN